MSRQPDLSEIRKRVMRRYKARFVFVVHVFLTLPAAALCAMVFANGAMALEQNGVDGGQMFFAVVFFAAWMSSLFIHLAWLLYKELSERAVQKEIDRQWRLASQLYDKPKRGASRLSGAGDDGELADLFDEDPHSVAKSQSR